MHMARSQQIAVRMPLQLLKQLDKYVSKLRAEMPGAGRSDVVRMLVMKGLSSLNLESEESSHARR